MNRFEKYNDMQSKDQTSLRTETNMDIDYSMLDINDQVIQEVSNSSSGSHTSLKKMKSTKEVNVHKVHDGSQMKRT